MYFDPTFSRQPAMSLHAHLHLHHPSQTIAQMTSPAGRNSTCSPAQCNPISQWKPFIRAERSFYGCPRRFPTIHQIDVINLILVARNLVPHNAN
ncbi:unnamed protein product [Macrosiphum euphorbiae]|uniref:Uncharacterized protein n=1 Tax=Macrosiphum euphorbiae TaxID=13131 RepID=A0AAV0WKD9_9HEMI|nr:unnamed protein product [Macrosiphum euphorbiae]